jgi:monothiol glutaredoxin
LGKGCELHWAVYAGVKYSSRNVLADEEIREGVKKFTNWPTIPQVGIQN